jgi:hypothetical protein
MTMFKRWQSLRAQFNPLASRLAVDPSYRLRSYRGCQFARPRG